MDRKLAIAAARSMAQHFESALADQNVEGVFLSRSEAALCQGLLEGLYQVLRDERKK